MYRGAVRDWNPKEKQHQQPHDDCPDVICKISMLEIISTAIRC